MNLTKEQLLKKIKNLDSINKELAELGFCTSRASQVNMTGLMKLSKQYDSKIVITERNSNEYPFLVSVPEIRIYSISDPKELIKFGLMTREEYLLDQLK